jgi:signal transduction histidine kinase
MRRRSDSVAGPLLIFVALGLVVLVAVGITGVLVLRRVAADQALDEARQGASFAARAIERSVTDDLLLGEEGTADALNAVDSAAFDAVLLDGGPFVHLRLIDDEGRIRYTDRVKQVGTVGELSAVGRQVLDGGGIAIVDAGETTDDGTPVVVVMTRIRTPGGDPLLLEVDQRLGSVSSDEQALLTTFTPVLIVALIALAILLFPLAYVLARRVKQADRDRERLLQRALDSSDRERRRLAGDLHDGPVQDLAGLSMQLAAKAEQTDDPAAREALSTSADAVRESVRVLRSAIVEVYPPNLRQSGLTPALSDLTARLRTEGLEVKLTAEPTTFGPDVDVLLYRAAQEGLRNVIAHAQADHVEVVVRREGSRAALEVRDDGVGVAADAVDGDDHLGLRILGELVDDADGSLSVRPASAGGTVMRVEVPVR